MIKIITKGPTGRKSSLIPKKPFIFSVSRHNEKKNNRTYSNQVVFKCVSNHGGWFNEFW